MAQDEERMRNRHEMLVYYIEWYFKYLRYLLPAIIVILTLAETWAYPPESVMVGSLVVAHLAALALTAFHPVLGSNIVLATFVICCFMPDNSGPSFLWGTWLALAYVGLYIKPPYGAIYPLSIAAVRMWRFDATGTSPNEYVMLLLAMFLAFFAGRAVSWNNLANHAKQEKLKVEKMQQYLAMTRKENIAASQIHDSITGNLTYMAILLDNKSLSHEKTLTEAEVIEFRAMIIKTLHEVRTVINVLNGDDKEVMNTTNVSFAGQIQAIAEQGDRSLRRLGFSGETKLSLKIPEDMGFDCFREMESLLQELYTNTAAHAKPNGEYYISINCSGSLIHIDQVNEVSDDNLFPDKPASSNGLRLHRERISSLGGGSRVSSEDGTWQFHARIPITSAADMAKPM